MIQISLVQKIVELVKFPSFLMDLMAKMDYIPGKGFWKESSPPNPPYTLRQIVTLEPLVHSPSSQNSMGNLARKYPCFSERWKLSYPASTK